MAQALRQSSCAYTAQGHGPCETRLYTDSKRCSRHIHCSKLFHQHFDLLCLAGQPEAVKHRAERLYDGHVLEVEGLHVSTAHCGMECVLGVVLKQKRAR